MLKVNLNADNKLKELLKKCCKTTKYDKIKAESEDMYRIYGNTDRITADVFKSSEKITDSIYAINVAEYKQLTALVTVWFLNPSKLSNLKISLNSIPQSPKNSIKRFKYH